MDSSDTDQETLGFGVSFSELGWQSLNMLSTEDRNSVMVELFLPGNGAGFTIRRTPVGANDLQEERCGYEGKDYARYFCKYIDMGRQGCTAGCARKLSRAAPCNE